MPPVLCEILRSGFMIKSSLIRRIHLVQSLSVVFLYWFYVFSEANFEFRLDPVCIPKPMPSSSGNSSGSGGTPSGATYSPPDDGLINEKKRKRMESNRESARRSRLRKQKHAADLMTELNKIKNDNDQIRATISVTTQRFVEIEAENSVLRAQVSELSQRLDSLNEILNSIKTNGNCTPTQCMSGSTDGLFEFDLFENPWNMMGFNQQPIMASADNLFGY
ncbi:hypothetical protein M8C21_031380 [Ambrosia artemisiifolia]|uniref:BZIP domain-containing protein n=1 Tax=Ambrosia artemisiifolia TaxID=4212 RepID=A0AAD5GPQ6_AMBAR|nr:hypothetical protein M8C21_031380 [Ambrosia artemisiifolia]